MKNHPNQSIHCRDLGVIIANNCQPRLHINTNH